MFRTALTALIVFSSFAATLSVAPTAEARSSLMISGNFGVRELYPKTLKSYKRAKAKLARLARFYRNAVRRGDNETAARYKKAHGRLLRKAKKAQRKLQRVRTSHVVVWGDAMDRFPPKKIAAFLRKHRKWQGKTVHIYGRDGKLRVGKNRPATFDRRGQRRPAKKPKKKSGFRPQPTHGGFIPQTQPIPGADVPSSGGLFGIGDAAR